MSTANFDAELAFYRAAPFLLGQPLDVKDIHHNLIHTDLGTDLYANRSQLTRHMAVMGVSGSGKSKFIELLGQHLIDTLNGFTFIDPHGDTAEALLDYVITKKGTSFQDRLHYLQPTDEWCFALDPFHELSTNQLNSATFAAQRNTAVDELFGILMRNVVISDQDIMLRLKRWLRNVLIAIATPTEEGERFSLADAFAILRRGHRHHTAVFHKLLRRLPADCQLDFAELHSLLPQKQYDEISSTINRLTDFLDVGTHQTLGLHAPSINFRDIISNRHAVIVNLRKTNVLSRNASRPIAGMIVREVMNTCEGFADRDSRTPHNLIIDEASEFLGEDYKDILEESRKFGLSLCLAGQSLSSFRKGDDLDIVNQLLSHCKTVVCFQQRGLEDVEYLGKYLGLPNHVLYERHQRMDVPAPELDQIVLLRSFQEAKAQSVGQGVGEVVGQSATNGVVTAKSKGRSVASAVSATQSTQEARQRSDGCGVGTSMVAGESQGMGHSLQPMIIDGILTAVPAQAMQSGLYDAYSNTNSRFSSSGQSVGTSRGFAETEINGEVEGQSEGTSRATSTSKSSIRSTMQGNSISVGHGVREQLVHHTALTWQPTGQPLYAIPYQNAVFEYLLSCLPPQYAFLRSMVDGVEQTVLFRTRDVKSSTGSCADVRAYLDQLFASKSYMFRVTANPDDAQDNRMQRILVRTIRSTGSNNHRDGNRRDATITPTADAEFDVD